MLRTAGWRVSSPNGYTSNTTPAPKTQGVSLGKEGGKSVRARGPRSLLWGCCLLAVYEREATPIKSQQHDCLNKTRTITATVDSSLWMKGWRAVRQLTTTREGELAFPGYEFPYWLSNTTWSTLGTHFQTQLVVFICSFSAYCCVCNNNDWRKGGSGFGRRSQTWDG